MGGRGSERAFEEMQAIAGKASRANYALTAREVASETYGAHLAQFLEQLKTPATILISSLAVSAKFSRASVILVFDLHASPTRGGLFYKPSRNARPLLA